MISIRDVQRVVEENKGKWLRGRDVADLIGTEEKDIVVRKLNKLMNQGFIEVDVIYEGVYEQRVYRAKKCKGENNER